MDQCPLYLCPVNHGTNMICFSVCNSATARCGEFDLYVAIWVFQFSPYCVIVGPKCEAMKDIFILSGRAVRIPGTRYSSYT
jgi:hypothetical protein